MVVGPRAAAPDHVVLAVDLPALPSNHGVAAASHELHELLGIAMAVLVAIHVAAALRHHFLLRDPVLARMLPWVRGRG